MSSASFLAGLLAGAVPGFVTAEDLDGPHGLAVRAWQGRGFVAPEPGRHPAPSCPHCADGVPYRAAGRVVCSGCRSDVGERELLAWPVDRDAFLAALAGHLGLQGRVQSSDGALWELGGGKAAGESVACFFHPGGSLSPPARDVVARYRRALVLSPAGAAVCDGPGRWVSLARVLEADGSFAAVELADLLSARGRVEFDPATGVLRVGGTPAGEVPLGGREWALLACLAEQVGQFVPYADLKREVLRRTGGRAETEEATFCQKLKSRIKEQYVPGIDRLVVVSGKGDGYRLRAEGEGREER